MAEGENQSPRGGLRQIQRREAVFEDVRPYPVSVDYEDADLVTTRAGATWGPPVDVRGRDAILLVLDITVVAGQTGLTIAYQYGLSDTRADEDWYDLHGQGNNEAGTATVIPTAPLDLTLDVSGFSAGVHRIAVSLLVRSSWMRFKPFAAGTVTGSRCRIRAVRSLRFS